MHPEFEALLNPQFASWSREETRYWQARVAVVRDGLALDRKFGVEPKPEHVARLARMEWVVLRCGVPDGEC